MVNILKTAKMLEKSKVQRHFDQRRKKWLFSITDIISISINRKDKKVVDRYWAALKSRLNKNGSNIAKNCIKFKIKRSDGKYYKTDITDIDTILYIIHSIPGKFK